MQKMSTLLDAKTWERIKRDAEYNAAIKQDRKSAHSAKVGK